MRLLNGPFDVYAIGCGPRPGAGDAPAAPDSLSACVGEAGAMRTLRALLLEEAPVGRVESLDDAAVVALVTAMVQGGRLWLVRYAPVQRLPAGGAAGRAAGAGSGASSRAAEAGPAAPRPAPAPPAPAPPADPPTFVPSLDPAALAATLRAAAEEGVPFCEECERARRAA